MMMKNRFCTRTMEIDSEVGNFRGGLS